MRKPFDPKQLPEAVGNACVRIWRAASRRKRVLEEALRDQVNRYRVMGLDAGPCQNRHLYNLVNVSVSGPIEVNWTVKGYEVRQVEFCSDTRPDSVIPEDFYSR